jgi:signal peptidase I
MEPKKKESFKDFLFITVTSLILVFAIRTYIAQPFVVSGESMDPTFHTGEYLIVDQLTYNFNNPQRGDVIVFRYPVMPSKFFIKRIIGLPGETIKIQGEKVFIKESDTLDFIEIKEDYIEFEKDTFMETKLEDDQYFVMGDNRLASLDSRIWGPLDEDFIVGRALVRLFPIDKLGILPGVNR